MKKTLLALLLCFCTSALGQSWPAKPVRIVVPFPPGGITDILARLMAAKLGDAWGQSVIVENRVGASGNIGVVQVARSAPDGYTFLVTSTSIAVNATLNANPGYDIDKDFAPVINLASSPNMIITHAAGPKSLRELIDSSRAGGLIYGSAGAGTTPHLTAEYLFKNLAGLKVTHVSYKGAAPAVTAALSGEVVAVSVAMTTAVPHVKSGKLRGLAVTSRARMPVLPDVPTVQEAGFAGFEDYTWVGMFAPAGTPREIVAKVNTDANAFLAGAEVRERLASLAFDPIGGGSDAFATYLKAEVAKWAKVIKETGAKIE
ncbi:MAG TPA: tripartite tricarboxylate transporter substrate binding protein [Burkholderiales bacterium]|nr:tripartite tricarboxylate transporter substrate binding protein [Burkholderiales bacterium]